MSRGGSVLVGVRRDVPCTPVNVASGLEMRFVHIRLAHVSLLIGVFSRPPGYASFAPQFAHVLSSFVRNFSNARVCVSGDLNYADIDGSVPCGISPKESNFVDVCETFELSQ